jgi:hypothetical protein
MKRTVTALVAAGLLVTGGITLHGSSHREAPGITKTPKLDGTDFYMFRSYEPGRQDYVTLLANYVPLQDVYGGPNFFPLDTNGLYEIHVDNDGDAREDITFQFRFTNIVKNLTVPVGGKDVAVPLINIGPIGPGANNTTNLNVIETYTLDIVRGDRRTGRRQPVVNAADGSPTFRKPVDRIGDKSIRNNDPAAYGQYADTHIYDVHIPGCDDGRVFVGQRRDGFVVNLAEAFDLINLNPLGPVDGEENSLADKNITTIALEVPINCLVDSDPVIGAWTTSSKGKEDGDDDHDDHGHGATPPGQFTQVSRLGSPLVNELVIGLKDKDKFNGSEPKNDAYFADYVTNPTLPVLIQALFGVTPPATPRNDLVQVFLTGVPGLNQPANVRPSEMLRLNTSLAPVAPVNQNPLGVIGGDLAGFPNGRRPGDDVVDIALRAVEGILLASDPSTFPKLTDGAFVNATISYKPDGTIAVTPTDKAAFPLFRATFPYLQTPISGSPNPAHVH